MVRVLDTLQEEPKKKRSTVQIQMNEIARPGDRELKAETCPGRPVRFRRSNGKWPAVGRRPAGRPAVFYEPSINSNTPTHRCYDAFLFPFVAFNRPDRKCFHSLVNDWSMTRAERKFSAHCAYGPNPYV